MIQVTLMLPYTIFTYCLLNALMPEGVACNNRHAFLISLCKRPRNKLEGVFNMQKYKIIDNKMIVIFLVT